MTTTTKNNKTGRTKDVRLEARIDSETDELIVEAERRARGDREYAEARVRSNRHRGNR